MPTRVRKGDTVKTAKKLDKKLNNTEYCKMFGKLMIKKYSYLNETKYSEWG